MVVYRFVWRALCGGLGVLGLLIGIVVLPIEVLITFGLLAVIAALTMALAYDPSAVDSTPRWRRTRARAVMTVACAGVALVAAAGLGFVLGGGVLFVLALLGATSPAAVRWYGERLHPRAEPTTNAAHQTPTVTTTQLCREWHDSYAALARATTPHARLRIVLARQRCLDELERRDPDGLHAWLESNASAGGDPSRFLAGHSPDSPPGDAA